MGVKKASAEEIFFKKIYSQGKI